MGDALQRLQQGAWLPQELQMQRENLRKGQASLDRQLERLTDAYLHAVIPLAEYERPRHELQQKIQVLGEQERALAKQAILFNDPTGPVIIVASGQDKF